MSRAENNKHYIISWENIGNVLNRKMLRVTKEKSGEAKRTAEKLLERGRRIRLCSGHMKLASDKIRVSNMA